MNSRIPLLGVVLAIQLVIVMAVYLSRSGPEQGSSLLDVDPAAVTKVSITDGDGATIELDKTADGWLIGDGLQADTTRIDALLDKLIALNDLWPVATTSGSQARFEVADDRFQRRLEIDTPAGAQVLFLGTSPGYRRVHARNAESDEVFSIEFANYEVPTAASEWLDKTQLQAHGVKRLSLADSWTLEHGDEGWLVDGQAADQDAAGKIVDRVANLRLLGVFDGDETALGDARVVDVEDDAGSYELSFRHEDKNDEYVVTSSRRPGSFTVASYVAEQVLVDPAALQPSAEPAAAGDGTESTGEAGDAITSPQPAGGAPEAGSTGAPAVSGKPGQDS